MGIEYVTGDATRPVGDGNKVIVHICNDLGAWGKGFVLALSARWKKPEESYRQWFETRFQNDFGLGSVDFVEVEDGIWVANLVGQAGVDPDRMGRAPIRYQAVRIGLAKAAVFCKNHGATMHMPRIGTGLAGGKWEEIEPHLQREVVDRGVDVTVYDLPK